ncbi:MAG: CPBP family intramembrane metalloprotease [Lachnospiraceae bacterium]|nr:CPBP family intramembrane metalloprotease [Lachnospiraceae bacterium]
MEKLSEQAKAKPWMSFVLFAVVMALFLTAGVKMQTAWGMLGLVLTELMFLLLAVVYALITKVKFREMFPVRKITLRDLFGCMFLHLGGFLLSVISVMIVSLLIPSLLDEAEELNTALYGQLPLIPTLLIVALMPAVCEEAIHRGAILSGFRSLKKDWVIVLIMAILFGLNHVSVLRFFATAILGAVLSYVVVKKNNILLSILIHFVNNAISTLAGTMSQGEASYSQANVSAGLGVWLILGFLAPVFLVIGSKLLDPEHHKNSRFAVAGVFSALMLAGGIVSFAMSAFGNVLLNSTISYEITEEQQDYSMLGFDVEKDTSANVVVVLTNAEGDYRIRIDGDKGSNIINADVPSGTLRTIQYQCDFQADHYDVYVVAGDNAIGEQPMIRVMIR